MATDTSWVGPAMQQAVPWVKTTGITFEETTAERVVARLDDRPELHNHVGGPHAAMIFGLGETASGAITLAAFAATQDRATPLPVTSTIHFQRVAKGPLTAVATLGRPVADVLAELEAGTRPEFPVEVTISDADGKETSKLTVLWTLRPNR